MRILYIHAADFWYRVRERVKVPQADPALEGDEARAENCLVAFTTVESRDVDRTEEIVESLIEDIALVMDRVKAETVVIYPYAHLSKDLARPSEAVRLLLRIEGGLKARGFKTNRSPFGWYKEFKLHCLGHPLAELSREF